MPVPQDAGRPAGPPARRPACIALICVIGTAAPAVAQLPDPFVIPRGSLRLGFEPAYTNYDRLFNAAGDEFPLGAFFSADSLGTAHFPTLTPAEAAVRAITGDGSFRFNVGALRGRLDADIRRLPFTLGLGLTRWVSFVATVPLVTTRVNSTVRLDSTGANAGWNLATSAGDPAALDSILILLGELSAAAAQLDAAIAGGAFGCPSSEQCDQARDLVVRARDLSANLSALTGIPGMADGGGTTLAPPFAPLATSPAGQSIQLAIAGLSAELQAFGIAAFSGSLPLPVAPPESTAVDQVLAGDEFGYGASPLNPPRTVKLSGIGDIELGLRFGLAQGDAVRAVLGATVRLPTGKRDDPANFLDIATGDRQTDLVWTLDAGLEPGGPLGLWLSAAYTLQLADRLDMRVTTPGQPLAFASTLATVDRNLGDVLRLSAHPALRLAPDFRAFISAVYERKWADRVSRDGAPVPELEAFTEREAWAFGAGLLYRLDQGKGGAALPIEASLSYHAAYFGSGGATPKTGRVALSLRLYYNLWGRTPTAVAPDPPQQ
jgi:hypothetical protein